MSLILEALRKSEAERRRGHAPDLRTELPPVAPPRTHALPRWTWALFAVALLALAWLLLARPGAAPPDEPSSTPEDAAAPVEAAASAANPATGQARDAGSALQGRRTVVDPAAAAPPPPESATAPRPGPASPAAAPASAIAGGSGAPPSAAAGIGSGAGTGTPATTDANDGSARTASAAPLEPSPAMPPPAAPAQPVASRPAAPLLALSDLSAEERRQLPPLKLSMHMWSQDPARRFVILDGQRLAEGDRAGPAVIDAIRSDDVVLAWNGMRLRLSLR